jgi:SagB-type dehydrogenase family enzyme
MRREVRLYRRSPTLFARWAHGELVVRDFATGVEQAISLREMDLLNALTRWTTAADAEARVGPGRGTATTLERLARSSLVERADQPSKRRRTAIAAWRQWSPEAAIFHFGTKDVRRIDLQTVQAEFAERISIDPPPPPLKGTPATINLPPFSRRGPLAPVLLARRSWRKFGAGRIEPDELSTLLGLTWAVQRWIRINGNVKAALKTSPSAGACHPIEVYVVAQRVRGLHRGIYHYQPDDHALAVVRPRIPPSTVQAILNGQRWFADCAALFVMTAVFPRVQWKYPSARAYRTVLLDAGHLCQTFCLVATALGLAPFCSASFADTRTERLLKIDGVNESVVYAAGVGRRPPGRKWAPWPDDIRRPPTALPAHRRR